VPHALDMRNLIENLKTWSTFHCKGLFVYETGGTPRDCFVLDVSTENLLRSVLHTLAYADVFDYPLTADQVYRYLPAANASFARVNQALAQDTLFSKVDDYYTLRGREEIVETRRARANVARQLWQKAARYGRILSTLPFVRMVAVTGSLAMNNTEAGKDIDFMIVTAPNYLWTCRALTLLVARLAKLEGVHLCPNYLVTTNALELQERSLYVAHELAQMIPLSGRETYAEMRRLNGWMTDYLPNALMAPEMPPGLKLVENHSVLQKVLEIFFRLPFVNWLEQWEMNRKIKRLSREQASSVESYFSADVCKGHIDRHGENVVTALAIRLREATDPQGTS
jgi:predicted nucleotidyltransferase